MHNFHYSTVNSHSYSWVPKKRSPRPYFFQNVFYFVGVNRKPFVGKNTCYVKKLFLTQEKLDLVYK